MQKFTGIAGGLAIALLTATVFAAGRWSAASASDTLCVTLTVYDAAGQAIGNIERQVRPAVDTDAWEYGGPLPAATDSRYVLRVQPTSENE